MPIASTETILNTLKSSKRLPSPPGTALKVLELCRTAEANVRDIAEVIMSDPALSGRMLKFANSPLAGLPRSVTTVREAVTLLGLAKVKMTALGFSILPDNSKSRCPGFDLKRFWGSSFLKAVIARRISLIFPWVDREQAFTAGLLANIGQLALAHGMPDEYRKVLDAVGKGASFIDAEQSQLGTDHVAIGIEILKDWGIPESLREVIHAASLPETTSCPKVKRKVGVETILICASRLLPVFTEDTKRTDFGIVAAREIVERTLRKAPEEWGKISEDIVEEFGQVGHIFQVKIDQDAVLDVYAEAQEEAARAAMNAEAEKNKAVQEREEFAVRASTDRLTGLANRGKFDERMEAECRSLLQGGGPFSLVLVDIDHFKQVNDKHGHPAGDSVLCQVAATLGKSVREDDLLARFGGEEFAVIAPGTDAKGGCVLAARLRRAVDESEIPIDGGKLHVTISLGVASTCDYERPPEPKRLIADADAQLYLSKKAGRNVWSYRGKSIAQVGPATAGRPSGGVGAAGPRVETTPRVIASA